MPVVINDLMVEPKAAPPADEAKGSAGSSQGSAPAGPELERQIQLVARRGRERGLRLWAH